MDHSVEHVPGYHGLLAGVPADELERWRALRARIAAHIRPAMADLADEADVT